MTIAKMNIWQRVLVAMQCGVSSGRGRAISLTLANGIFISLLVASCTPHQATTASGAAQLSNLDQPLPVQEGAAAPSSTQTPPEVTHHFKRANFELEPMSNEARHLADWVVDANDNLGMPFVIVDKTEAKVFVFYADGRLRGAAPALLGQALGDDGVPGIGDRALLSILPEERTTPAGRFVGSLDHNLQGKEILWVDYAGAISMHPVLTNKPKERRAQRLATPTPLDNRISYGCINIPAKFFENVVRPAFTGTNGIVYVLAETKLNSIVFGSYDVE